MGRLKELLFSKMQAAGLSEDQEKAVMDVLETKCCLNHIEEDIEGSIDEAIREVLDCKGKDKIIAELREKIHALGNQYQTKYSILELQNLKLRRALKDVLNFEINSFPAAKDLIKELDEDNPSETPTT
jgi:hypothetical protein